VWDFVSLFTLWDYVLWYFVPWDYVGVDFVPRDFVMWDFVPDSLRPSASATKRLQKEILPEDDRTIVKQMGDTLSTDNTELG